MLPSAHIHTHCFSQRLQDKGPGSPWSSKGAGRERVVESFRPWRQTQLCRFHAKQASLFWVMQSPGVLYRRTLMAPWRKRGSSQRCSPSGSMDGWSGSSPCAVSSTHWHPTTHYRRTSHLSQRGCGTCHLSKNAEEQDHLPKLEKPPRLLVKSPGHMPNEGNLSPFSRFSCAPLFHLPPEKPSSPSWLLRSIFSPQIPLLVWYVIGVSSSILHSWHRWTQHKPSKHQDPPWEGGGPGWKYSCADISVQNISFPSRQMACSPKVFHFSRVKS